MIYGIIAGITWALETIILGIALSMTPFTATEEAIFLAPFVSTFLHDACSSIWAAFYNGIRGNAKNVWYALAKTKSGTERPYELIGTGKWDGMPYSIAATEEAARKYKELLDLLAADIKSEQCDA